MALPVPSPWTRDTADTQRDEKKREESPCSFFFSQGRALVLAAEYFCDTRLSEEARGGVAIKHRHRIHLALFGQLLAAFEYMLKDFIAKVLDCTDVLDAKVQKAKWIEVDPGKVLASRAIAASPGSILIHPTVGWHDPEKVNSRYEELFQYRPIQSSETPELNRLWILRHSVAHNAGFVIHHDAFRIGNPDLSQKVVNIDAAFISDSFSFLCPIAKRVATQIGENVLRQWLGSLKPSGCDFTRDGATYRRIKSLATYIDSRAKDLPIPDEASYLQDFQAV